MTETGERIKEARERDEAAAQGEGQDEGAQAETREQEAPQAAAPQPTEKQIDKAFEQASKSAETQGRKVAKLLGLPDEGVLPCPCCDVPGYVFAGRAPLEGDRLLAVKAVIGEEDMRAYKPADNAVECEVCSGYGKLVRPTKVPDQVLAVCTACNGYGWHAPQQPIPQYTQPEQPQIYYPQPSAPTYNGPQAVYSVPPQG